MVNGHHSAGSPGGFCEMLLGYSRALSGVAAHFMQWTHSLGSPGDLHGFELSGLPVCGPSKPVA